MPHSIGEIATFITSAKEGKGLYQPVPETLSSQIRSALRSTRPDILGQLTFLAQMNPAQIADIPEQVKNRILAWACELESAGVTGDGVSFSEKEKRIAQNVVFHIRDSTIDQLNSSGANIKGNTSG